MNQKTIDNVGSILFVIFIMLSFKTILWVSEQVEKSKKAKLIKNCKEINRLQKECDELCNK